MNKILDVIYENGVFRPLEPVNLPEHQRIRVQVENEEDWLDTQYMAGCADAADDGVNLTMVRQALAKIADSLTPDFVADRSEP